MSDKQIHFTVVVNGQPVPVKANAQDEILEVVQYALKESGNSGQPVENWELRDASGHPIDTAKKVGAIDIKEGAKLFLSLKAGVGGSSD